MIFKHSLISFVTVFLLVYVLLKWEGPAYCKHLVEQCVWYRAASKHIRAGSEPRIGLWWKHPTIDIWFPVLERGRRGGHHPVNEKLTVPHSPQQSCLILIWNIVVFTACSGVPWCTKTTSTGLTIFLPTISVRSENQMNSASGCNIGDLYIKTKCGL